ncbi:MAG: BamA/TamA family outer membrane protein [bacterium]
MKTFPSALSFVCSVLFWTTLFANSLAQQKESTHDKDAVLHQVKSKFLFEKTDTDIEYFEGTVTIPEGRILHTDVLVYDGDLIVAGEIFGNAVAVFGDVLVEATGAVEGDVISVDGAVTQDYGAWIKGESIETTSDGLQKKPSLLFEKKKTSTKRYWQNRRIFNRRFRFRDSREWEEHSKYVIARYNRVEGTFLGFRLPQSRVYRRWGNRFGLFGEAGYGFDNDKWRYQIGGQLSFLQELNNTVGAEYHDFTDSQDFWLLPTSENTLTALLAKKDFFDYYERKGFSVFAVQKISYFIKLKVAYTNDEYFNIDKSTNWALFRGGRDFRFNPLIEEGRMRSLNIHFSIDTRDAAKAPREGWLLTAAADLAGGKIGGDFEFDRYLLDIRRYQPLSFSENLDFRIRIGSSTGTVPSQFLFDVGGLSTLPGYHFKEFTGNRMLLFNPEFRTDGDNLFGDIWFLDDFNIILFANSGYAWFSNDNSSPFNFDNFNISDLKTDVGFAISTGDGNIRLNFAQRLDKTGSGINISFRVNRNF